MPMPVKLTPTEIPDVITIESGLVRDERGYFAEIYSEKMLAGSGFRANFVQDNVSSSKKGSLRGLHYQIEPHGMGKLIRVLRGSAFDVAVDIRLGSPSFGKWVARTLSADNKLAMWIPPGFAHGFLALEEETVLLYKCTATHTPESERAIHFADPKLGIAWPEEPSLVAAKDAAAPAFAVAEYNFEYGAPSAGGRTA
jgi:dTDP-4-dehydrorhamnose 3,5-epimerase